MNISFLGIQYIRQLEIRQQEDCTRYKFRDQNKESESDKVENKNNGKPYEDVMEEQKPVGTLMKVCTAVRTNRFQSN